MSKAVTVTKKPAVAKKTKQVDPSDQLKDLSMKMLKLRLDLRPIDEQLHQILEKRKQYEDVEKHLKMMFTTVMREVYEQTGEKTFENHLIKLTYIAPSTQHRIDSKRLKLEKPEIAKKYGMLVHVTDTVRLAVK